MEETIGKKTDGFYKEAIKIRMDEVIYIFKNAPKLQAIELILFKNTPKLHAVHNYNGILALGKMQILPRLVGVLQSTTASLQE